MVGFSVLQRHGEEWDNVCSRSCSFSRVFYGLYGVHLSQNIEVTLVFLLQYCGAEVVHYTQQMSAATENWIGVVRYHMLCGDVLDVMTDARCQVGTEEYVATPMMETEGQEEEEDEEESEQDVDADS